MNNAKDFSCFRVAAVMFMSVALSACGTRTVSEVDSHGMTETPIFPSVADGSRPEGSYVNLENLHKINKRMTKVQVQDLIGPPHFSEGMYKVQEWDYIFKFRQPDGLPDKMCQFKVLFDSELVTQSFYYLPQDCLQPAVKSQGAKPEPKPMAVKTEKLTLAADATFAFGSAQLSAKGENVLLKLFEGMRESNLREIQIIGYSDRIGSQHENEQLSLNRAVAVRSFFIQQGINANLISVDGRGSSDAVVTCPGVKTPQLIECLAPNRRTVVTIVSE
jgi:OOP family OmpA-OmpF porin